GGISEAERWRGFDQLEARGYLLCQPDYVLKMAWLVPGFIPNSAHGVATVCMPFGKHRGQPLAKLPDGYLAWLFTLDLDEPLRSAVDAEYKARESGGDDDEPYDLAADIETDEPVVAPKKKTPTREKTMTLVSTSTPPEAVMPWGKYKGEPFTKIPTKYLKWIMAAHRARHRGITVD